MKKIEYRSENALSELKKTIRSRFDLAEDVAINFIKGLEDSVELIIYNYNFLFSGMDKDLFKRQFNNIVKFLNKDSSDIANIEQIIETSKITKSIKPHYLSLKTYLPDEYCDELIYDQYKKLSEQFATKKISNDKLKQIISLEIDYLNQELKHELKLCKTGK